MTCKTVRKYIVVGHYTWNTTPQKSIHIVNTSFIQSITKSTWTFSQPWCQTWFLKNMQQMQSSRLIQIRCLTCAKFSRPVNCLSLRQLIISYFLHCSLINWTTTELLSYWTTELYIFSDFHVYMSNWAPRWHAITFHLHWLMQIPFSHPGLIGSLLLGSC